MAASETHGGTFGYENREEKKEETKGIREWPWMRKIAIYVESRLQMELLRSMNILSKEALLFFLRSGLSAKEYEICDFFVYIPQYGCGTASLNVTVAASIVLHHFGVWAGFSERVRDGSKFIVADRPLRQGKRNICAGTEESIVEERKLRKENAENGFFDEDGNGNSSESSSSELLNGLFLNE
uniref:tRNA/rRNA methyltransferase SpoU type domain-containing protein n=1 Tax=Brassica oleracea var. oleracea TaxID=109376 RepID=A0A0D3DE83_BRAOL